MVHFDAKKIVESFFERVCGNKVSFLKGKNNKKVRARIRRRLNKLIKTLKEKKNSNRETELLELAQELWEYLMICALKHISIAKHIRGFNELREYYHKSVKLEDLLFGIDPTYRDHTMHAIWVYLLGDYILHDNTCIGNAKIDWGIDTSVEDKNSKDKSKLQDELEQYVDTLFCISALCHDLAYPFEMADKVNKRIEEMYENMGLKTFERLQYRFSVEQGPLIRELLELTSLKAIVKDSNTIEFIKDNPTFVDMSQSFEQRRHGILSSYLLYRLIDTMGEITHTRINELQDKRKIVRHLIIRRTIFHTISSHTCVYAYSIKYNTPRFLLSLFDELEEFSRYMRLGRGVTDEICRSGFSCVDNGVFEIEYLFNQHHIADPKLFFFDRAKRLCRMVEVENINEAHAIKEVTMTCIDKKSRNKKPKYYKLKIDDKGATCMLHGMRHEWHEITPNFETKLQELSIKYGKRKKNTHSVSV